jgi:Na+-transporting methylmalonyl-CoA/oxaloacetate decarboxylase gamma subunit|tara:strand:+ start:1937 stop:2110 length:174 start_codon:yes stop_codon:yes gene_type:complete
MKTIILLSILGYFIYRISQFLLPFFLFGKKKSEKEKKAEFHRKVRSMDIQDAEYEDK